MGYIHTEIITENIPKRIKGPSGDVTGTLRDQSSTIHFLFDGIGSGIKANIAATMNLSRIQELISRGFTFRDAFLSVVNSMEEAKKKDMPLAFFSAVRIINNGIAAIIGYDMPSPIYVSNGCATVLKSSPNSLYGGLVAEYNCDIKMGRGILLVSDGITQAGLGKGLPYGWGIEELNKFINRLLMNGVSIKEIPREVIKEAKKIWKGNCEDDCTVSLIYCAKGIVVNLLTGPPLDKETDELVINEFLNEEGIKIICGATTAKIAARILQEELIINPKFESLIAPPDYELHGIDLVTEGAVTLNQLYNIWEEDFKKLERNSPVTELYSYLTAADKINIFWGTSNNPADEDISFRQTGILKREKILPLLVQKFKEKDKLVSVKRK